ncbi:hypothetical protein DBV15_01277 [Temnothorax longispinosus]|uniref:Uncharacterized protein n=1 Tax=Temnothorax longispinosus TaxID=300112 RepID=A0A4S2KJF2_9HYME|nr:hypothetical protein DBV15_01277 [Temnothorax longispinosus]
MPGSCPSQVHLDLLPMVDPWQSYVTGALIGVIPCETRSSQLARGYIGPDGPSSSPGPDVAELAALPYTNEPAERRRTCWTERNRERRRQTDRKGTREKESGEGEDGVRTREGKRERETETKRWALEWAVLQIAPPALETPATTSCSSRGIGEAQERRIFDPCQDE